MLLISRSWAVVLAMLTGFLVRRRTANACVSSQTSDIAGTLTYSAISDQTFSCPTNEFIEFMYFDEDNTGSYPGRLEAVRFECTDGSTSAWLGDELSPIASATVYGLGGLSQLVRHEVSYFDVPTSSQATIPFIGNVTVKAHSDFTSNGVDMEGPFSYNASTTYYSEPLTSTCGVDARAVGATVWNSSNFVYAIQFECAELTSTCVFPGDTAAGTPSPTATSSASSGGSDSETMSTWIIIAVVLGTTAVIGIIIVCTVCKLLGERTSESGDVKAMSGSTRSSHGHFEPAGVYVDASRGSEDYHIHRAAASLPPQLPQTVEFGYQPEPAQAVNVALPFEIAAVPPPYHSVAGTTS